MSIPTDRKAKKGYYRIGEVEYQIRPNLDDDFGFIEMVGAAQTGSMAALVRALQYALNDDDAAYDALKEECTIDGRVSAKAIGQHFEAIQAAIDPN